MKTDTRALSGILFAVASGLTLWPTLSIASADDGLPYNTEQCDDAMKADLAEAISMARSLLISNRQGEAGLDARVNPLLKMMFGVYLEPQTKEEEDWNILFVLGFSNYEAFVHNSFTNPEQETYPVQGKRITFLCNGTSMAEAAEKLDATTILLHPAFTGKLSGTPYAQIPLIERTGNNTRAGTILHEMVHLYTGGIDICRAGQCVAADRAVENASANDPIVFSTPSNYEFFYQYSYWYAPAL